MPIEISSKFINNLLGSFHLEWLMMVKIAALPDPSQISNLYKKHVILFSLLVFREGTSR